MESKSRSRLADMLVRNNIITRAAMNKALEKHKNSGMRVAQVIVAENLLTDAELVAAISEHFGIERVFLDEVEPSPELLALVPETVIRKHHVFPFKLQGRSIHLAVNDPFDFFALDDVRALTRFDVVPFLATADEIDRAIDRHHSFHRSAQQMVEEITEDTVEDEEAGPDDTDDSPRIRIVNMIIAQAIRERVSDIHIEPQEDRLRVRYRVDGRLRDVMEFPNRLRSDIVSRIKVMADLDITERRRPQDGRLRLQYEGTPIDIRASTLPTIFGEKVVLRILAQSSELVDLERIGFQPENLQAVKQMLLQPQGIVLVTGPTGSGKTTTLYSFLDRLNKPDVNIITIQDPVELRMSNITQVNVHTRAGLTFASALRSVLRQDPDIIMVGEIRDQETTEISVRAALTGHLVLSTIHTNSAAATVGRLVDMGIERYLIAETLTGIISQRLVRRVCSQCVEDVTQLTPLERYVLQDRAEGAKLRRGKGCPACSKTGYRGRLAVEEVLLVNRRLRDLIRSDASEEALEAAAIESGMVSLKESAIRRVLAGETTVDEIVRAVYSVDDDYIDAEFVGDDTLEIEVASG